MPTLTPRLSRAASPSRMRFRPLSVSMIIEIPSYDRTAPAFVAQSLPAGVEAHRIMARRVVTAAEGDRQAVFLDAGSADRRREGARCLLLHAVEQPCCVERLGFILPVFWQAGGAVILGDVERARHDVRL